VALLRERKKRVQVVAGKNKVVERGNEEVVEVVLMEERSLSVSIARAEVVVVGIRKPMTPEMKAELNFKFMLKVKLKMEMEVGLILKRRGSLRRIPLKCPPRVEPRRRWRGSLSRSLRAGNDGKTPPLDG
jgi:hypothetical protein